jgi:6,7-dimethyl-8-ribityllumazine synthase|tara:strand:+ start:408 stop:881 length:474 start_codon:yes stop_codon:yes gene_type:complete
MASANKNISSYDDLNIPDGKDLRIAIVVAQWNQAITNKLYLGAREKLLKHNVVAENIVKFNVPGSFELIYGATKAQAQNFDVVIAIGCIIQGETRHFEFIANAVAQGIKDLNLNGKSPVIFCVLTDDNIRQSQARSGGKLGNKGVEAAIAALRMFLL